MPIKKSSILTKEDFEEAIISLRLSISELARETGIPRQYLSHFRTYGDGLKPEQVAKVRDYLEAKLSENGMSLATEDEQDHSDPAENYVIRTGETPLTDLDKRDDLARALLCVRHFALSPVMTCDQITAALERMDANDRNIRALLSNPVESGFLNPWGEKTEGDLQEVFGLMAENHILFCHLQGRALIGMDTLESTPPTSQAKDVAGIVAGLLAGSLRELGSTLMPSPDHEGEGQVRESDHGEEAV
jgi:hypothetical protein